jgi:hypothetical protein
MTALSQAERWRVGAALLDPPRQVISSLQLATCRFETAQRRQRLVASANNAAGPLSAIRRPVDRR